MKRKNNSNKKHTPSCSTTELVELQPETYNHEFVKTKNTQPTEIDQFATCKKVAYTLILIIIASSKEIAAFC